MSVVCVKLCQNHSMDVHYLVTFLPSSNITFTLWDNVSKYDKAYDHVTAETSNDYAASSHMNEKSANHKTAFNHVTVTNFNTHLFYVNQMQPTTSQHLLRCP